MSNAMSRRLRCRQITDVDAPSLVPLLASGFRTRSASYWSHALRVLADRDAPAGYPRFGYLLEAGDGVPAGVVLTIFHRRTDGEIYCNISSWHVTKTLQGYASLLIAAALRHREVVYLNISPAESTWPIIEAQGFGRYCEGQMLAAPALSAVTRSARILAFDSCSDARSALPKDERALMREHVQKYACIGLVVQDGGETRPFLFLPRLVSLSPARTVQLVYCRNVADFSRYAGALGRALLRHGYLTALVDANGKLPGVAGRYFRNRGPKYFKGPRPPRLGDLSFCENVLFGP
jgi:hypothetical protein